MGVDLQTYRCRVGCFVSCRGAASEELSIGLVPVIKALLIIAGIEQNPGPVVSPRIDQKVEDQSGRLGEPWELKVSLGGDGPFEIKVKKDGIKLTENDHIKISSCNDNVTITIKDVEEDDSGTYKIKVSNDSGSATCTFNMVVCKYNFRYQYLLVEVGTKVLRKLFDSKVGQDFRSYLAANTSHSNILQLLIKGSKGKKPTLTADQAKLLPPLDSNPTSAKFDITLLTCLLRNICGLKSPLDTVWNSPALTDFSEEACITKLRQCRNNVSHSGTVLFPAADFADKWRELSSILFNLNKFCSKDCITDLQSLIDGAAEVDIDEGFKEHLINTIQQWYEFEQDLKCDVARVENLVTTVMKEQRGMKRQIDNIQQTLTAPKHPHVEVKFDLKDHVMEIYKRDCGTLQVSPLCCEDEEEVDLLTIYQPPSMCHVPYHRQQTQEENYPILSYEKIFCRSTEERFFRNIFITGDAGVGKTSFCHCMSLLWCKSQSREHGSNSIMQKDIDFMHKFEFVFYVSLRESDHVDILDMIIDQLFYTKSKGNREEMYTSVENILKKKECLIILDALDEWTPKTSSRKECVLPKRIHSKTCTYLTTCRPYKIENVRLSKKDLDHQVKMTGIHGLSSRRYVREIVNHISNATGDHRNPKDFLIEVKQCGLDEQLSIPMIASQLIVVWFDKKLTDMCRALIYSNIVEMLFQRAEKRKMEFPSSAVSEVQHPDSLSELSQIKKHFPLLKETCLLAFRSLFRQDESISVLVFTEEMLKKEPYCISTDKIDFLCKIGVLSKNKVIGGFGKKEHKLSFLHKSYIEYFAGLFVSSFDTSSVFDDIVTTWTTVNDVVQFQNFFILLAGFSYQNVKILFENIYLNISHYLTSCRRNSIFHYDSESYSEQIKSFQTVVENCFKEVRRSIDPSIALKLEDFIINDNSNDSILLELLVLNKTCVKSVYSVEGKYFDEFDDIDTLECLSVGKAPDDPLSGDCIYDAKFTECMLQNESTLHTVCIQGNFTLLPEIPISRLYQLTSLSLNDVKMQHDSLRDLVNFLSINDHIEHIKLHDVACDNSQDEDSDCTLTLNLPNHTQLTSLCLERVDIICSNVNSSNLLYITLDPLSETIFDSYFDTFNCIKESQLEHLFIHGLFVWLDYNTMRKVISTVKTLPCIKSLKLWEMIVDDDILLQLHRGVKQTKIKLYTVTISSDCFHSFVGSMIKNKSVIKVELEWCLISVVDGETRNKLNVVKSIEYMADYLVSKHGVKITNEDDWSLYFETTGCQ